MTKTTIRNEFTNQSITVDPGKPLTRRKIANWRSKLHAADCTSGDTLGGRGPQDDPEAYASLLERANYVVSCGEDEVR